MVGSPLTNKQIAFCREYVKDSNGKQAAIRAGYSVKTAEVIASQVLRLVKVKQEIGRIVSELAQKAGWSVEESQKRLLLIVSQAERLNQPAAAISGLVAVNRMYGMDKDAAVKDDTPESISAEQADEFRAMARAATKLRIA